MVVRNRLQRAGEGTSLEKGRLQKSWLESQLEKRINQKHIDNLKKVGKAVNEVARTSAWAIREGSKVMADTLSMKTYWDAMDALKTQEKKKEIRVSVEPRDEGYVEIKEEGV